MHIGGRPTSTLELLTVAELRRFGFTTRDIRRAVEQLRAIPGDRHLLATLTLVRQGDTIGWKRNSEVQGLRVSALRLPKQLLLIFPLGEIHASLLRQLQCEDSEDRERAAGKCSSDMDEGRAVDFSALHSGAPLEQVATRLLPKSI